jgi:ferric-dicitrate binding protein FerR (iron transport regulator)
MSTEQNIPENDPDLMLARQYGEVLEGNKSPSGINNPFLNLLLKAQTEAESAEREVSVSAPEPSWNAVQKAISEQKAGKEATVHTMKSSKKWYWAAAAAILITFSFIYILQQALTPDPQLIAESGDSLSVVELADGSMVTLRPNSELYEVSVSETSHSYALSGEGLFEVEPDPGRTFSVASGPGRVIVTGTRFNLNDRNQQAAVYLLEGSVRFETAGGEQSVELTPGEAAVIDEQNQLRDAFEFQEEEVTGWTQNRMIFRDRLAASVFNELEAHFDIRIVAPDEVEQITLGGSVSLDTAEQSLEDLGAVLGGRFEQTGEATYQFRPDQ